MAGSSHIHQIIKSCWNFQDKQIPNFSRLSTLFQKQFKDFFSFLKFKDFSRLALISRPAQEPWNKYSIFMQTSG